MATVKFSVPDEVQEAFQEVFAEEDQDSVITQLMRQAVEERRRILLQRATAIEALLELRRRQAPISNVEAARARQEGRP